MSFHFEQVYRKIFVFSIGLWQRGDMRSVFDFLFKQTKKKNKQTIIANVEKENATHNNRNMIVEWRLSLFAITS